MKCFNHTDTESVGICMNCGKGICETCIVTAESDRLTCSAACAEQLGKYLVLARDSVERSSKAKIVSAVFLWVTGVVIFVFGVYEILDTGNWKAASYFLVVGPLLLLGGTFNYLSSRKK